MQMRRNCLVRKRFCIRARTCSVPSGDGLDACSSLQLWRMPSSSAMAELLGLSRKSRLTVRLSGTRRREQNSTSTSDNLTGVMVDRLLLLPWPFDIVSVQQEHSTGNVLKYLLVVMTQMYNQDIRRGC
jgi:hypothetical protein